MCLRQGIGALLLDRVLRGQDKEGLLQPEGFPAGCDFVLLHRLEQGGLRLGRGAVDLIGKDDVGEDGAFDEPEGLLPGGVILLQDLGAGDVRGHQVRRELDTAEGEAE